MSCQIFCYILLNNLFLFYLKCLANTGTKGVHMQGLYYDQIQTIRDGKEFIFCRIEEKELSLCQTEAWLDPQ